MEIQSGSFKNIDLIEFHSYNIFHYWSESKLLKLPNIQKYEVDRRTADGFIASVEMDNGFAFKIHAYSLQQAFPSTVLQLIEKKSNDTGVRILISPYISDRTAEICEKSGMGYFDYAGNCWFVGHSIYLSERGNKNPQPKQCGAVAWTIRLLWKGSCGN